MIAKRLFLDFAPSEWQSLVSQVSAWSHWTPAGEKRLAHDLTEEKLSAIIKKANGNVLISILVPATEVLAEYLPAMEEAACEQNTLDDMERRMKEEINLRLEIQAEMDKQKEKYEANMKKMMLLIDKLNAALKAKEEQYNSLESELKKYAKIMQVQEDTLKKTTQDLALLRKGGTTESHLGVLLDVFRKPKARGVVLDFLEARDILKIASSCKAARHYSLLGMRPMRHLFDHKKKELSVIQSSYEKALSHFNGFLKTGYSKDEYVHFLLYKFFERQWRPGSLAEETLSKSQVFINSVNDEASDTISFDQKTSSSNEDQDEEEKAAKHLVLTLKQVELLLSRLKYKTGEIPESIMKAKQEAYNKSVNRLQATLKQFNSKIESAKNIKMVAQRCFLYFIEMYHLATFLIAESGELSSLKDFLCRQLYQLQSDVELKDQMLETLNCNVQTVNKSRDFIYSRCTSLENKVNELSVELLSASQIRSAQETSLRQVREEFKALSLENNRLSKTNLRLSDEVKESQSKLHLTDTMASVLVHIDSLLQGI